MREKQFEILKKIERYDKIIIHRHTNPDLDAIGSQLGLKYLIENWIGEKPKTVYAVGEEVEHLQYLGRMDKLSKKDYLDALVIVLDTANKERISLGENLIYAHRVIKIDHHPKTESYADYEWIDATSASTSEMVASLSVSSYGKMPLTEKSAKLLYAGIVGDTGGFKYRSTSSRTHALVAELYKTEFDPSEIYEQLGKQTMNEAKLKGYLLSHFKQQGKVVYIFLDQDTLESYNVSVVDASNLVNELSGIEGIEAWVLFVQSEEGIRTRIRSREYPINHIANEFGGGGHPLASGVMIDDWNQATILVNTLNEETVKQTTLTVG